MTSELQAEIRDNVSEYLRDRKSLAELENWLWPFLADLEDNDDARGAGGRIGSLISEYSYGHRNEESMRQEMSDAIRPFEDSRPDVEVVGYSFQTESMSRGAVLMGTASTVIPTVLRSFAA